MIHVVSHHDYGWSKWGAEPMLDCLAGKFWAICD
jgi:hypothetical protein